HYGDEHILVVANLSRFVEYVELDLSAYRGWVAVEMFGRNRFPPIGDLPYLLTLGPHSFYWMSLEPETAGGTALEVPAETVPSVSLRGSWLAALRGRERAAIEEVLPAVLRSRRWYGAKAGRLRGTRVLDTIPIGGDEGGALVFVQASLEGGTQTYALPMAFARGDRAAMLRRDRPDAVFLEVSSQEGNGILFDALEDPGFCSAWL